MSQQGVYPKVAIAWLTGGMTSNAFTLSLLKLILHETFRTSVPPFVINERCGTLGIVDGRNEVVRHFLDRTKSSWLLFIDDDMGFAPDALERLLRSADRKDRPVMGGLCFGMRRETPDPENHAERFRYFPTLYAWREFHDRVGFEVMADYPRDKVVPVSATGAAFVLIHRSVLEKIRERDGDNWFSQVTHPIGPTTFSEDMSFCVRVAACDFPLHVDTSVKICHDKGGIFLDERAWDRQQALDAPVPVPV